MFAFCRHGIVADGGTEIVVDRRPDETTSQAVLRGIAALKGATEDELNVLFENVEPESLNELMEHSCSHGCDVSIVFTYEGCTVLVRGKGEIEITDRSSPAALFR